MITDITNEQAELFVERLLPATGLPVSRAAECLTVGGERVAITFFDNTVEVEGEKAGEAAIINVRVRVSVSGERKDAALSDTIGMLKAAIDRMTLEEARTLAEGLFIYPYWVEAEPEPDKTIENNIVTRTLFVTVGCAPVIVETP